jgi:hypothetical protein
MVVATGAKWGRLEERKEGLEARRLAASWIVTCRTGRSHEELSDSYFFTCFLKKS